MQYCPLVDDDDRVVIEFELNEGRNRQIRKMRVGGS